MKTTTKQACQLHSHEAVANVMGLVISVVWYLQADIPVITHLRHLSVNCESVSIYLLLAIQADIYSMRLAMEGPVSS